MIRAVIFDMFETLVTHYKAPLYFSAEMAEDAGVSVEEFRTAWYPTEEGRSTGKYTLEEVLEIALKQCGCYSPELLQKIAEKRKAAKVECFKNLHEDIIPMLSGLKEKGIKIGLISNCFSEETEVIRQSELFPYFDAVCLSYEEGVQKPDVEIFRRCMERLGVKAEECLYVGDGGSRELETASSLGMKAVQAAWYLKEGTSQPSGRKKEFKQMETPLEVVEEAVAGNPWTKINLSDYENHMSLESVHQLQALNGIMKEQFETYDVETIMILGVAGGNGLEHIDKDKIKKVYGVDVNQDFLAECKKRYSNLGDTLEIVCADLLDEKLQLPYSDLIVANLLIEYIGYECFQKIISLIKPLYVSCIIQINTGEAFVSDSPYVHAFDCLEEVHHQMEESNLADSMGRIGYLLKKKEEHPLPNGKKFIRLDFAL